MQKSSYIRSENFNKPNVLIGEYNKCLDYLFDNKLSEWIIPKLLWIDFYVLPLTILYNFSLQHQVLEKDCYFLKIVSIADFDRLLQSTLLPKLLTTGFSSLIVNYPPYCSRNGENWMNLKKLTKLGVVSVFVTKDLFPLEESNTIVVDPE